MKISKDKFKKLMNKGKGGAKAAAAGSKGTALEGAAGAACAYGEKLLKANVAMARDKPWLSGAALVVAGHFIKKTSRRYSNVGAAVCGAGGYSLGIYLQNRKAAAAATPAAAPAPSQTSGIYDMPARDTGAVQFVSSGLAA